MSNAKDITELRNRISEALYDHREDMKQETYKTLYETLASVTKNVEEKQWVRLYIICNSAYPVDEDDDDCEKDFGISMQTQMCHRQVLISKNGYEQIKKRIDARGCCGLVIYDKCICQPLWTAEDEDEEFYFCFDLPGLKYNCSIPRNAAINFVKIELL